MTKHSISFVSISEGGPLVLTIFAHVYAVVVTLTMVFPAINIPTFASIHVKGIIEADQVLRARSKTANGSSGTFQYNSELMDYPLETVYMYQQHTFFG